MSKVTVPLLSHDATGSLAQSHTHAHVKGLHIVKRIPTHYDARTLPQLYQRWRFIDAKYYWRDLTEEQRQQYETDARPYHMTGWAYFLRQYLTNPFDQILWLRLDELGGSSAKDFSGKANDGTVYGAITVPGWINLARQFDGVDDRILVPHHATLDPTTAITLSAWVFLLANTDPYDIIITKQGDAYILYFSDTQNQPRIYVETISAPTYSLADSSEILSLETWYHILGTYDPVNGSHIYVNGIHRGQGAPAGNLAPNANDLMIGAGSPTTYQLNATLDDTRIYNRRISLPHIQEINARPGWPPK